MGKKRDANSSRSPVPYAKKSLGQNFLVDDSVVGRIVRALTIVPEDTVVEIGPGRGALTDLLVKSGASVIAIELDDALAGSLRERYREMENVRVINADALQFDLRQLATKAGLKLVANLPYYISTPILRKLFKVRSMFSLLTVMVQKEVAERILAGSGESERGFLTVLLERGFKSEYLFTVAPGSFRPVPKVTSAVIRLIPRDNDPADGSDDADFEALASAAFRQKRKTLRNNLVGAPSAISALIEKKGGVEELIRRADLDPTARAEALTRAEWSALSEALFE